MIDSSNHVGGGSLTLIVEPEPEGHRLYYVGLLVDSCRSQGRSAVVLTTPEALESTEWALHLAEKAPEVVVRPLVDFTLVAIAQVATEVRANLTIVSYADPYLLPILRSGWRGPGDLSLLVLRADGQPDGRPRGTPWLTGVRGAVKKALAWSAGLRPRIRVSALRSPLVTRRGPLRWTPDPITLRCDIPQVRELRQRLDSYGDIYWLGVFGAVTPRKNLPLIIEAILDQPDVGLVVAGSIYPEVEESIASLSSQFAAAGGHLVHLSGPLTDAEFDAAISAVDCVVVAHSNEGPSGVLLKAAASGRRLVLAGAKSLKRDATCLGEQAVWLPLDAEALRRAIDQCKRLPAPHTTVRLGAEGFLAALA